MIDQFAELLEERLPQPQGTWADPKRKLSQSQYLCLFLFALFNPVVRSVRAVCSATELEKVRAQVSGRSVSLGSFSEAQHLCDLLEGLVGELSQQVQGPAPKDPNQAWQQWLAQDSSLFAALPRMKWAVYGGGKHNCLNNAVRLHLSFNVLSEAPVEASVTAGKTCERQAWKEKWRKGAAYIGDRNYSESHPLLSQLEEAGCRYILRLREPTTVEIIEELPLSAQDVGAGILRQALAHLGKGKARITPVRVIWIKSATAGTIRLATNLSAQDTAAKQVAGLYRRRWQIESFFRWIKRLLGCRRWLAESHEGVRIQLYLGLIAGLLLHRRLGKRPNKRMMELLQLYQLGWATIEELDSAVKAQIAKAKKKENPAK